MHAPAALRLTVAKLVLIATPFAASGQTRSSDRVTTLERRADRSVAMVSPSGAPTTGWKFEAMRGPSGSSASSVQVPVGSSFRSVNFPDRFIRHRNFGGVLESVQARLDSLDATFVLMPGLANPRGFSFQSVNFPGYYLRHSNFQIRLQPDDGSQLFKEDATFMRSPGLAGRGISFESVNYPGYFIRHSGFVLYVRQFDGTQLFREDASFELIRGLAR